MKPLKAEAAEVISRMPDEAGIDDIMYELYVLEKLRKAEKDIEAGRTISTEELEERMGKW
jgi:hypothetical protein